MASERILCAGKIERGGEIAWRIAGRPADRDASKAEVEAVEGELQRLIDEAAQLEEYRDWVEDQTFWSRGNW